MGDRTRKAGVLSYCFWALGGVISPLTESLPSDILEASTFFKPDVSTPDAEGLKEVTESCEVGGFSIFDSIPPWVSVLELQETPVVAISSSATVYFNSVFFISVSKLL